MADQKLIKKAREIIKNHSEDEIMTVVSLILSERGFQFGATRIQIVPEHGAPVLRCTKDAIHIFGITFCGVQVHGGI